MKILHILYSNQYSGAENVVCQIMEQFCNDVNVEMVYCSRDGQIREVLLERNLPFVPITDLTVKGLKRVLQEQKPDVVHAHDFRASVISAAAVRGMGIRLISHLHNNPPWIRKVNTQSVAYLFAGLFCEKILLVSDAVGKEYVFNSFLKKKEVVIGNPINILAIKAAEVPAEKSDLIFVGRLSEQKNPLRFLQIVSDLQKQIPDIQTIVLGDGELRQECEAWVASLGLQKNVKFLGFQKNPYDYMTNSRVLCMTSDWEGFGLVAVEALSLGKPVVCKPVGGLTGIVEESCGRLCQSDAEYLEELTKLLQEETYYMEKSAGAFQRAEALHNIERYKRTLQEIYRV